MGTGTNCGAPAARLSATMSTPARSAACWPTRSCSISTKSAAFHFESQAREPMRFPQGAEGSLFSRAVARHRSRRTRFDSSLCRRRSAGIPHRRRGRAARSWRRRHRGHSAAPSPSRIDPFPHSRQFRLPCRGRMDGPHWGWTDRAHLAARARFVGAGAAGAGGRGADGLFAPRYAQALQTSVCLFWRSARDLTLRHAQRVTAP